MLLRRYRVDIEVGAPKVSYRESPTKEVSYDYKHKKQSGGSGQFAHIKGILCPIESDSEDSFEFEENIVGGRIPKQYIPAVEKGFRDSLGKGPVAEYPVVGTRIDLDDGSFHEVDSNEIAFKVAGSIAFRNVARNAGPVLLEPIMEVEVTTPEEYMGDVIGDVTSRRGRVQHMEARGNAQVVSCKVPLAEMFGYSTTLRSLTQGKAEFTMEFASFKPVPKSVSEELIKKFQEEKKDN